MTDAEMEAKSTEKWRAFIAAIARDEVKEANRIWRELQWLMTQRTPEQHARYAEIAKAAELARARA